MLPPGAASGEESISDWDQGDGYNGFPRRGRGMSRGRYQRGRGRGSGRPPFPSSSEGNPLATLADWIELGRCHLLKFLMQHVFCSFSVQQPHV